MKVLLSPVLFLAFLGTASAAGRDPVWTPPEDSDLRTPSELRGPSLDRPPGRSWCYPSGLAVHAESTTSDGLVVLATHIGSGSAAEEPDQHGVAHLLEHLWFRTDRPEGQILRSDLQRMGVWRNAFTNRDSTVYLTNANKNLLGDLLTIEAARLVDPLSGVTEEEVALETEVVRNELRLGWAERGRAGTDALFAVLFPEDHPYHHPTVGTHASLSQLRLATAQAFADAHYRPDNASLHLRGDVNLRTLQQEVTAALPLSLRAGPEDKDGAPRRCRPTAPTEPPALPPPPAPQADIPEVPYPGTERIARLGWVMPVGFSREGALNKAMLLLLGWAIEESSGQDAACFQWSMDQGSLAVCDVEVPAHRSGDAMVREMENGVEKMFRGFGWSWVFAWKGARWAVASSLLNDSDEALRPGSLSAMDSVAYAHRTGRNDYASQLFSWVATPNAGDAKAHFDAWFGLERAARLVLVPATEPPAEPADLPVPEPLAGVHRQPRAEAPSVEELTRWAALPGRDTFATRTLDNGLTVLVGRGGAANLTEVRLVLPGGQLAETAPGANLLAESFLETGGGKFGLDRFSVAPRSVSGQWLRGADTRGLILGVTGSSATLDTLLYLVRRSAEQARIEPKGWRPFHREAGKALAELSALPERKAEALRLDAQVGDHPARGALTRSGFARWKETSRDEVRTWLEQVLHPAGATLVVSTRQSPERTLALAETWFSGWEMPDAPPRPAPAQPVLPPPPPRTVTVVPDPASVQRIVTSLCVLDRDRDLATEAERIAVRHLDQQLIDQLRVQHGWTYSPRASLRTFPGGGVALEMSARVQPGTAAPTLSTLLQTLEGLAERPLPPGQVWRLQEERARSLSLSYRSTGGMAGFLSWNATVPGRLDWLLDRPEAIAAVTPEAVSASVRGCVGHETVTVRGPEETAAALTAAGFSLAP